MFRLRGRRRIGAFVKYKRARGEAIAGAVRRSSLDLQEEAGGAKPRVWKELMS